VLLAGALAGCASNDQAAAQISHVHGLGVNPGDGKVYVATHHGLYRIDGPDQAVQVGPRQDTMGFTVAGPDRFLGSGHPAPGRGGPRNLGLIESTDAGATWKTMSLAGRADFHRLRYAHNSVYGYDATSGTLRVSADKTTWDHRVRMGAADIAVSPTDPNIVLATTEQGVARSSDGGRTFTPGNGQVQLLLAWPAAATLYGLDPAGTLSVSADGGATWRTVGNMPGGQPQAFTAVDQRRLLAATTTGIHESRDGGATFTRLLLLSD